MGYHLGCLNVNDVPKSAKKKFFLYIFCVQTTTLGEHFSCQASSQRKFKISNMAEKTQIV